MKTKNYVIETNPFITLYELKYRIITIDSQLIDSGIRRELLKIINNYIKKEKVTHRIMNNL